MPSKFEGARGGLLLPAKRASSFAFDKHHTAHAPTKSAMKIKIKMLKGGNSTIEMDADKSVRAAPRAAAPRPAPAPAARCCACAQASRLLSNQALLGDTVNQRAMMARAQIEELKAAIEAQENLDIQKMASLRACAPAPPSTGSGTGSGLDWISAQKSSPGP